MEFQRGHAQPFPSLRLAYAHGYNLYADNIKAQKTLILETICINCVVFLR